MNNEQALVAMSESLTERAKQYAIVDADTFAAATEMRTVLREKIAYAKDQMEDARVKTHDAYNAVLALINKIVGPMKEAEKALKGMQDEYLTEQRRKEDEARRKSIAVAAAEEERKRKALLARADKAEENGQEEKAEAIRDKAQELYIPSAPVASFDSEGVGKATAIEVDAVDIKAVCKAIAEGRLPLTLVKPDMTAIKAFCKLAGDTAVPGIRFRRTVVSRLNARRK